MRARLAITACTAAVIAAAFGLGALVLYDVVRAITDALP